MVARLSDGVVETGATVGLPTGPPSVGVGSGAEEAVLGLAAVVGSADGEIEADGPALVVGVTVAVGDCEVDGLTVAVAVGLGLVGGVGLHGLPPFPAVIRAGGRPHWGMSAAAR
ncbi:hypothetical protein ACIF6L_13965 [Kitasatospora sp. NPDC086009]|uniref:hypothetical protein n=1 Tax=unclassified Kitasatospora TaxID=2633591 RepID=UPI0037C67216